MDPLTAFGLATNILTFLEVGTKLVSGAIDIYGSSSGLTGENRTLETVVMDMRILASKFQACGIDKLDENEKSLLKLATECDDLSRQIIDILEKTRPRDPRSKTASLRASLKSMWYEQDRHRLAQRLGDCRAQMSFHMTYLASSETRARLNTLVSTARQGSDKLERLITQVQALGQITTSSFGGATEEDMKSLQSVTEHASDLIAVECILKSLEFPEMHRRYGLVTEAHHKTFRWMFTDEVDQLKRNDSQKSDDKGTGDLQSLETSAGVDPEKRAARSILHSWLESGTGIFHICGKLGSGKSTLMKYICDHEETGKMLKKWAGE